MMGPWGRTSSDSQSYGRDHHNTGRDHQQYVGTRMPSARNFGGVDPSLSGSNAMNRRSDILLQALSDLNNAIVPREVRLNAIMTAIEIFNHEDQARHDCELDANADKILFQKLAFALSIDRTSEEVGLICTALELVYRGSRTRVAAAFNEFGMTALPFIMLIIHGNPKRKQHNSRRRGGDPSSGNLTRDGRRKNKNIHGFNDQASFKDRDYGSIANSRAKSTDRSMGTIEDNKSINSDMFSIDSYDKNGRKVKGSGRSRGGRSVATAESFKTEDMDSIKDDLTRMTNLTEDMQSITTEDVFSDHHTKASKSQMSTKSFADDVSAITGVDDDLKSTHFSQAGSRPDNIRSGVSQYSKKNNDDLVSMCESKSQVTGVSNFSGDFGMSPEEFSKSEFKNDLGFEVSETDIENLLSSRNPINIDDENGKEEQPSQVGVFKILKVLRYFSRVLSAMVPLAHHPGLLDSLLYQLEKLSSDGLLSVLQDLTTMSELGPDTDGASSAMTTARIDTIAVMVNLACAEENKATMVDHPGLLDSVINVARNDPSDEAREHSAIVLMNLSYSAQNKELMAEHDQLLSTLTKLMKDSSPYTRKYAASALFALASVVSRTALLTTYCGSEILEALRQVLLHDPSDEARINAAEALFNMAKGKSEKTAIKLCRHPNLLDALAEAVIADYSADVRAYCARGLESLSGDIHHPLDCHREMIRALIKASQWTKTTSIADALKFQASVPANRVALVSHQGLLEALAALASLRNPADQYVRSCALSAIERLSTEPKNRPIMARSKEIMEALTVESFRSRSDGDHQNSTGFLMREAYKNLASVM